jgi:putative DNA primase/helicase
LYQEFFDFQPEFKLWLVSNHKPVINDTTHSIWRRVKLIPFNIKIPRLEQDRYLADKLLAEKSGILNWMLAGCLKWQQAGLKTPIEIKAAVTGYRAEMDYIGTYLAAMCVEAAGAKVQVKELYEQYLQWCFKEGQNPIKQKTFKTRMHERGYASRRGTGGNYYWFGIGLVDEIHT